MQYTIDKAIELLKISKLTTKDKDDLFNIIKVHDYGSYYALTILTKCSELLTEAQKDDCVELLIKNPDLAVKYLIDNNSKGMREFLMPHIFMDICAIKTLFIAAYNKKIVVSGKEIAQLILSIKDRKKYNELFGKNYNDAIRLLLLYIDNVEPQLIKPLLPIMIKNIDFMLAALNVKSLYFSKNKLMESVYTNCSHQIFELVKKNYSALLDYAAWFAPYLSSYEQEFIIDKLVRKKDFEMIFTFYQLYNSYLTEKCKEKLTSMLILKELIKN